MKSGRGKKTLGAALAAMAVSGSPAVANAQAASQDQNITVSIPGQRLSSALRQFAEAAGLQLVYDAKITDGKESPTVSGAMTPQTALSRLLTGSGLNFRFLGERTVVITAAAGDGVRPVGVVSVEGVTGYMPFGTAISPVNGANGSRDVETTEGTRSYTTGATSIVSKVPQTLRETPQSVSVVTAQRIQDQSLTSIKDILVAMPGTTFTPGPNSEEFSIFSRGFEVKTFSFDGGAPVSYDFGNRPVINMSEFDSVQLLRGANGMYGGYGDPGGTVNLVRKKPLDHRRISYTQEVGSWHWFREEFDATQPLTEDGSLRGRVVVSRQDNKFFYRVAEARKTSVYGVLDYDLAPKTLLTFGASRNYERNIPNQGGLPRYADGEEIDFPTWTCLCLNSNYDRADRTGLFATLAHQLTDNWSTKLNLTYNRQQVDAIYYGVSASVYRGGVSNGTFGGFRSVNPAKDFAADYTMIGEFNLLDRRQRLVLGANYRYLNADGAENYFLPNTEVADVFNFDPGNYAAPVSSEQPDLLALRSRLRELGIYGALKLEIFDDFHLQSGVRYSTYTQDSIARASFSPDDQVTPALKDRSRSTPNIGFTYDFLNNYTLYGSHEKIYKPQAQTRYKAGDAIPPPVTGANDEVGLKWASTDQKLNASLSYYRITQNGVLTTDFENPSSFLPVLNDVRSRGFDLEIAGEVFAGLQVSASFARNDNSVTTGTSAAPSSAPTASFQPRKKLKSFVTYRSRPDGLLGGMIVGGGVDYQSSAYNTGSVCAEPSGNPDAPCPSFNFVPYRFTTKGYTTLSLMAGYQINKQVELSVIGKNLTNVKAYAPSSFQNPVGYNFYIEPASVLATLRVVWE